MKNIKKQIKRKRWQRNNLVIAVNMTDPSDPYRKQLQGTLNKLDTEIVKLLGKL